MDKQKRDLRRVPIMAQKMVNNDIEPERKQVCIKNLEKAIEILKNGEITSISDTRAERKAICEICPELQGKKCLEIKRKKGCSACSEPWNILHNKCPKQKWD
jgi:hypothetical protein